jgi:hypothetical protein
MSKTTNTPIISDNVRRGLSHLRDLAFGKDRSCNPDLPDSALADLETAESWLDKIMSLDPKA